MVPLRFVFRSRWWTLAWAAGMLWTAVDYAGGHRAGADAAANIQDGDANQLDAVAEALG